MVEDDRNEFYLTSNEIRISNNPNTIPKQLDNRYLNFEPFKGSDSILPGKSGYLGTYESKPSVDNDDLQTMFEKFMVIDLMERKEDNDGLFVEHGPFPTMSDFIQHEKRISSLEAGHNLTDFKTTQKYPDIIDIVRTSTKTTVVQTSTKTVGLKRRSIAKRKNFSNHELKTSYESLLLSVHRYYIHIAGSPRDKHIRIVNAMVERLHFTFTKTDRTKIVFKHSDDLYRKYWEKEFNKDAQGSEVIQNMHKCVSYFVVNRYGRYFKYDSIIQKVRKALNRSTVMTYS